MPHPKPPHDRPRWNHDTLMSVVGIERSVYRKWAKHLLPDDLDTSPGRRLAWDLDEIVTFAVIRRVRELWRYDTERACTVAQTAVRGGVDRLELDVPVAMDATVNIKWLRQLIELALTEHEPLDFLTGRWILSNGVELFRGRIDYLDNHNDDGGGADTDTDDALSV